MTIQGQRLFNRIVYGVITNRNDNTQVTLSTSIRTRFNIEKISGGYVNKMSVDFYNLSPKTIALLEEAGTNLKLYAGYDGTTRLIGSGDIFSCTNARTGPDIVTSIKAFDAQYTYDNYHPNSSVGVGGTNQQLLAKIIAGAMAVDGLLTIGNVQCPPYKTTGILLPLITYPKGQVASKNFQDAMDQIIVYGLPDVNGEEVEWTWSITDGVLSVTPVNSSVEGNAFKLNVNTGLIGVPSKNNQAPGALNPEDAHPVYTFQSLLNPLLNPDDMVEVESDFVPHGFYRIYQSDFKGDNFEGEFMTEIECWSPGDE